MKSPAAFSFDELESQIKAATLSPQCLVLPDSGQSREELRKYWEYDWIAITTVPGLEDYGRPPGHGAPGKWVGP